MEQQTDERVRRQRKLTGAVLAAAVGLVAWELYTLVRPDDEARTISEVVTEISRDYLMLPFAAGCLAGHWWWGPSPRR